MKIKVPTSMTKYVEEILRGSYDIPSLTVKEPTILDVGANVGSYTLWAKMRWPDYKRIECYEPHPNTFAILDYNINKCELRDVKLHNFGLDVEDGDGKVYNHGYNCGAATMRPKDAWGGMPDTIASIVDAKVKSIADIGQFDIIKCDAEGIEWDFIKHYNHWSNVKCFMVEYHNPIFCFDIFNEMYRLGFQLCGGKVYNPVRGEYLFARNEHLESAKVTIEKQY